MKIQIQFLALILIVSAGPALASEVRAKVRIAPGPAGSPALSGAVEDDLVVVWIDGPPRGALPKTKPSMSQRGLRFAPAFQVVVAGQTVAMPNDDDVAHNVFSYSPSQRFNLGLYPKGESKDVVFDYPGVVDIYCSIHRAMKAKILVVPNEYYVLGRIGEQLTLHNVPPGSWKLKVWHRQFGIQETKVVVTERGKVSVPVTLGANV